MNGVKSTVFKNKITREEIDQLPVYAFSGEVVMVEEESQVEAAVRELSAFGRIGFDTETKPSFRKGESHSVSLLQLANPEKVYLFRLNKCGFQPALRRLLSDPRVLKIGVGIRDDIRGLQRLAAFQPSSFIDLQEYATTFGIEDKSFSKLMAIVFSVRISKRQQKSNWEAEELSEAQVRYAATDAWGALKMYQELEEVSCGTVKGTVK